MDKVSIVIPVYNAYDYLDKCFDSILNQTFSNWEAICVDDCSSDDSYKKLLEYSKKDDRFKIFQMDKNSGSGETRNYALEKATGDYLLFMDPDDKYPDNDVIDVLVNNLSETQADACVGNVVHDNGKQPNKISENFVGNIKDYQDSTGWWRFIYKKSILDKANIKFPDLRRGQDSVFLASYMINVEKVAFVNKKVYWYRTNHKILKYNIDNIMALYDNYIERIKIFKSVGNAVFVENVFQYYSTRGLLGTSLANIDQIGILGFRNVLKRHLTIISMVKEYDIKKYDANYRFKKNLRSFVVGIGRRNEKLCLFTRKVRRVAKKAIKKIIRIARV